MSFRFEQLRVWQRATEVSLHLFEGADQLELGKRFRFAEQLRAAVLSISNNLAEGSGSSSRREFAQFVNIARRSTFEVVNMLLLFERQRLFERGQIKPWLEELESISRMLEGLRKQLLKA